MGFPTPDCARRRLLLPLKAFEVLADFLRLGRRQITDPVERLGEETVMSAAGRLVARLRKGLGI